MRDAITCESKPHYMQDNTLIAVKYLGNSIVQEMVTGERGIAQEENMYYLENDLYNFSGGKVK